jgi:DNA polymerase III subunit delta
MHRVTPSKPPVYLFWGEDAFLLREAAFEILSRDPQPREIEGGGWQGGELSDLATPSLFGERRALLVTDARSLSDQALKELAAYLVAAAPDAQLVLLATVPERGKAPAALVKLFQPAGHIHEVKVARKELPGWLAARAKAKAVSLAPDGAAALVDTLGEDTAALEQALDQLASAFPGERIGRDLVAKQFRGFGEQHVWDLCDKAFARDLPGSMRTLRTLLEARDDPLMILGGIASRLRDLMRVRELPESTPLSEVAREAGLRFEWQARRYREQAKRFTMQELIELHARLTEADRALKSGATDDLVLPLLITAIAGELSEVSLAF